MRKIWLLIFAILFPLSVMAQSVAEISAQEDSDAGFLTRLLQNNLSGAGRQVTITGFNGAMSSRATFQRITIADDAGVWLTLNDGAIQWTRSALLRGRVQIAELTAKEILLPRLPKGEAAAPQAEAREFALPELPVSLNIDQIRAERVELGEPVIGLAAAISLDGSMNLDGGEGAAKLNVHRLDGPRGDFILDAGYANETKILRLNLSVDEAANGLLVNLVNLYDRPSVNAQISGEGRVNDFMADIRLATDGQPRVTGQVSANAGSGPDGSAGTVFRLNLGGDIATLLRPQDRAFFGPDTQLQAEGWRGDDGRLNVPLLKIDTDALTVDGQLATTAQGAPETARLNIALGRDAGATQVPAPLPFAGEGATVESGRITLDFNAAQGQGWTLEGAIGQLHTPGADIGELTLNGGGTITQDGGALSAITGNLRFGGTQMAFADPGLAQAIGDAITGATDFNFTPGNAVEFTNLSIDGADYGLSGYFLVSGLSSGITLSVDADARYEDLARISTIAGRPLSGRADVSMNGYYVVLTRAFDLDAVVTGNDITIDQEQADRLLAGRSTIALRGRRDFTGIELDNFSVNAQRLTAEMRGYLNSYSSDVTAQISMPSLADADPDFSGELQAQAKLTGPDGARKLTVDGQAIDLRVGIEALDNALQGRTQLDIAATQAADGFQLQTFDLSNPQLRATGQGSFVAGALDATADLALPDLGALRPGWAGGFTAQAKLGERDGARIIDVTGTGQDLGLGQQGVDGALTGTTDLKILAEEKAGVITLRDVRLTNQQMNVTARGTYGQGVTDVTADADIRSLASFGPGWRGALRANGSFREAGDGLRRLEVTGTGRDLSFGQAQVDGALSGETRLAVRGTERGGVFTIEQAQVENPRLSVTATGKVGAGQSDVSARINAGDLRFVGNGVAGSLTADARLVEQGGARRISATGTANSLRVGQDRVDPLLAGQTSFDMAVTQSTAGLAFQRVVLRNPQVQIEADGDTASGMNIQARLADLGLVQPEFPGPVVVDGSLREDGARFAMDLAVTAPGDTRLRIAGTAARDFATTDLAVTGTSNASLANAFIRTRNIEGPLSLDLRIAGAPSLNAISGRVQLSGGHVADPGVGMRIDDLGVTADLNNGRIMIDAGGNVAAGGRLTVTGPVDLNARALDLVIVLDRVIARDPNLYQTEINGRLTMTGAIQAGPLIAGRIELGETEIRIPSTGLGGAKEILDIIHVGDTRPVRATRAKAGLEPYPSQASSDAGMAGPPSTPPASPPRLDLVIEAPNKVFVRGRGVDAELGGGFQVQGTTRNAIPIGHLELIRGRVDLLGKRFDLTEGLVELQGSLIPVLRLVAQAEQGGITTRIIIDGEVRDPDITFESSPDLPQEEVLSQLLFGRGLDNITPLQAAQLANAVAVLAGRGGVGIIGNLRTQVGLDDLDLATDDEGNVQVRAGKYLSDNLYTDVAVGNDGTSTINLNLDITDSLTARGSLGSDGDSTLGVYFERDY